MKSGWVWIRQFPLVFWILAGIQGIFISAVLVSERFDDGSMWLNWTSWSFVVGGFHLLALSFMSVWVAPHNTVLASMTALGVIGGYGILLTYHFRAQVPLSYPIIQDNWKFMDRSETWDVALSAFETSDLWLLGLAGMVLVYLETGFSWLGNDCQRFGMQFGRIKGVTAVFIYVGLAWVPWSTVDEFQLFLRSMHRDGFLIQNDEVHSTSDSYPYWICEEEVNQSRHLEATMNSKALSVEELPDIWIILVESFNRNFLFSQTDEGVPYTPFLNQHLKQGMLVEPFYANSTFTIKGWASTLLSVYPAIDGYLAEYSDTRMFGLPEVLKRLGYESYYFQAYKELDFANTGPFMKKLGAKKVLAAGSDEWKLEGEKEESGYWGWGLQDDLFYKKVFRQLDQFSAALDGSCRAKLVLLAPISSHSPFNKVPEDERRIYKDPKNIKQHYANAIAVADHGLKEFFDQLEERNELQNSLIFICGDHSFPMGEHGVYRSESGAYEEFFRTPLMVWWGDRFRNERRGGRAFTQMDIAPTILDWIGFPDTHPFQGSPISFNREKISVVDSMQPIQGSSHPGILFQPYGGRWFVSVRYPMKYIYHAQSGWEGVFDLRLDPAESKNLAGYPRGWSWLPEFRQDVSRLYMNQRLIESNRLRPPQE